jgi:hypothetical protein
MTPRSFLIVWSAYVARRRADRMLEAWKIRMLTIKDVDPMHKANYTVEGIAAGMPAFGDEDFFSGESSKR